ncbi:hypothetical protein GEMRC1_001394 [Eukaryota sp. GEM-RC1]
MKKKFQDKENCLNREISNFRTVNRSLHEENFRVKGNNSELSKEVSSLKSENDLLKVQHSKIVKNLQGEIEQLRKTAEESQSVIQSKTILSSKLSNSVFSLQSELSQSREFSQNLQNGISKLQLEMKSMVPISFYNSVKNELASTKQKNSEVSTGISRLKKRNSCFATQVSNLTSEVHYLTAANSSYLNEISKLKRKN